MIYLIRHAETRYNVVQDELKKKYGQNHTKEQEFLDAKFSLDFLDVDITQNGRKQCLQSREKMKDTDIDLIIVSPLRRALQTCSLVFQGHKSKAPVLVHPQFRQLLSSSNDIGSRLKQSRGQFPSFDFSLITDPDIWYLQNIQDLQLRQQLLSKMGEDPLECMGQSAIRTSLQFMKQNYKARQADPQNKSLIKKILPCLKQQVKILEQFLTKHRRIAVISHSYNIQAYIGYKTKNCEIFQLDQEKLEELKENV